MGSAAHSEMAMSPPVRVAGAACVEKHSALMCLLGGKQLKMRTPLLSERSRQSQTGEEAEESPP